MGKSIPPVVASTPGPKQIRLMGKHAGEDLYVGPLTFHKGLSQHMSAFEAESHAKILNEINANDGKVDDKGKPLAVARLYRAEVVDVGAPETPAEGVEPLHPEGVSSDEVTSTPPADVVDGPQTDTKPTAKKRARGKRAK